MLNSSAFIHGYMNYMALKKSIRLREDVFPINLTLNDLVKIII